jgi:hypothetical protein
MHSFAPVPTSNSHAVQLPPPGCSSWFAVEYDDPSVKQAGSLWALPAGAASAAAAALVAGTPIVAANCTTNGVVDPMQVFELRPDWLLQHVASGMCAEASANAAGATLSLQPCEHGKLLQQFRNDYTRFVHVTH